MALLKEFGVSHAFAGHYHRNSLGRDGPLEMVMTGPAGRPLGPDPSGIRIVIVRPTGLEHCHYGLASVPNRLKLDSEQVRYRAASKARKRRARSGP